MLFFFFSLFILDLKLCVGILLIHFSALINEMNESNCPVILNLGEGGTVHLKTADFLSYNQNDVHGIQTHF